MSVRISVGRVEIDLVIKIDADCIKHMLFRLNFVDACFDIICSVRARAP